MYTLGSIDIGTGTIIPLQVTIITSAIDQNDRYQAG